MATLELDLNKSIEKNASLYYEKAKKMKKKIEGAKEALSGSLAKLKKLEKENKILLRKILYKEKKLIKTKKEWYEKFRWFISSEGFLVIGGRDATTNEIIVKKHTDKNDLVFHTDMIGSPFFVVKKKLHVPSHGRRHKLLRNLTSPPPTTIDDETLREVADATATFSRAWKLGLQSSSVFYCKPEQLTKEAPSGEYVPRGGFVTKGKLSYVENNVNCAVGIFDDKIMSGPVEAIKKNCEKYVEIVQGREKASTIAKYIQKKIGGGLDEIIRALPSGGCKVKK